MYGSDADDNDQRNAVLEAIIGTQQRIAKKRQDDLEAAAAAAQRAVVDGEFIESASTPHAMSASGGGGGGVPRVRVGFVGARSDRSEFFTIWSKNIDAFVADPSKTALDLPVELSANDRRELHALADKYNLSHMSEGHGSGRHLVLRKDMLHYKAPQLRPTAGDIDQLKQVQEAQRGGHRALPGVQGQRSVESRYELRRVRHRDDEPQYADGDVEKAVRRLQRATDHYRHAVEVGMTMEEMQEAERQPVDELLAQPDAPDAANSMHRKRSNATDAASSGTSREWAAALATTSSEQLVADDGTSTLVPPSASSSVKVYKEQCLTCGTQSPLDYEVREWSCCGQCDVCRKETIFRLVEVKPVAVVVPEAIDRDDIDGHRSEDDSDAPDRKQRRIEPAAVDAVAPEEIDTNAIATVDEAVELMVMNDVADVDVAYLRAFAEATSTDLPQHLYFAIAFSDLMDSDGERALLSFAYRRPKSASNNDLYVWMRGVHSLNADTVYATAILSAVVQVVASAAPQLSSASAAGSEGDSAAAQCRRMAIALPSTSLYGTALSMLVRFDEVAIVPDAPLAALARQYGTRHLKWCRLGQLQTLLRETEHAEGH